MVSRNEKEKVLIEGSINSLRISIAIKQVLKIMTIQGEKAYCVRAPYVHLHSKFSCFEWNLNGHPVFVLSVCSENFNLSFNFRNVRDRDFILVCILNY